MLIAWEQKQYSAQLVMMNLDWATLNVNKYANLYLLAKKQEILSKLRFREICHWFRSIKILETDQVSSSFYTNLQIDSKKNQVL